jgi:5-methylcytosine-specific restriction endonuclease McrA
MARKVKLATVELHWAFQHGQRSARRGKSLRDNPYRPCSDGDLWRAWNRGFADPGSSKDARIRRNRARAVVERHGETCWLCHRSIADGELTMDHVVPRSKGGRATRDNLRPAHAECNVKRGNGPPPVLLLRPDMMLKQCEFA